MQVIQNEQIVAFDVDDTLIMWKWGDNKDEGKMEFVDPYSDLIHYLYVHMKHVNLLKKYKGRGFYVIVWSAAGVKWAEHVVKRLGLESYVDLVTTKFSKFVDDLSANEILGERVYLEPQIEVWKDIQEYEGIYKVSNLGNIKSLKNGPNQTERVRSITTGTNGYSMITLNKKGSSKTCYVHRLVATAFLNNPERKRVVHHIDNDKSNNHVENLEWVTQKENLEYSLKSGRKVLKGSEKSNKLNEKQAMEIYTLIQRGDRTKKSIADMYEVHPQTIHHIGIKKTWKHIHK